MLITILIFLISTIALFVMISFRVWEIKKVGNDNTPSERKVIPEFYFRHVEKTMLYLSKQVIQWIVLITAKGYFIVMTKTKKWAVENWPKIYNFFGKKKDPGDNIVVRKSSFLQKAIIESKAKIKNIREKVKKEHGVVAEVPQEETQNKTVSF
jgi:hypothetical protein